MATEEFDVQILLKLPPVLVTYAAQLIQFVTPLIGGSANPLPEHSLKLKY